MKYTSFPLLLAFLAAVAPAASLEFLSIPTTAHAAWMDAAPRNPADGLDGVWQNPAALGGLTHAFHAAFGVEGQLGSPLLSLGLALRCDALSFGLGVSGLFLGTIMGDLEYAGDSGKSIPALSLRASGAVNWGIHRSVPLPFQWNLGAGFQFATEQLDAVRLDAQFLNIGMLASFPVAAKFRLGISLEGRMIPWGWQSAAPVDLSGTFCGALSGEWAVGPALDFLAAAGFSYHALEGAGCQFGLEGRFRKRYYLRVGVRADANPTFTLAGGVAFEIPEGKILGIDLAELPGRPGGQGLGQLSWAQ